MHMPQAIKLGSIGGPADWQQTRHLAIAIQYVNTEQMGIIGILRGYAIRSGRRPEGSQRPQGGPQVRPGRWLPEGRLPDRIA